MNQAKVKQRSAKSGATTNKKLYGFTDDERAQQ